MRSFDQYIKLFISFWRSKSKLIWIVFKLGSSLLWHLISIFSLDLTSFSTQSARYMLNILIDKKTHLVLCNESVQSYNNVFITKIEAKKRRPFTIYCVFIMYFINKYTVKCTDCSLREKIASQCEKQNKKRKRLVNEFEHFFFVNQRL